MQRTWEIIEREMKKHGLSARLMAQRLQMDPSQLSRLRSGEIRDLSGEALGRLLTNLSSSVEEQQEILTAYLSDKLAESKVQPGLVGGAVRQVTSSEYLAHHPIHTGIGEEIPLAHLDKRLTASLQTLGAAAKRNRRLRTILLSLVNYIND